MIKVPIIEESSDGCYMVSSMVEIELLKPFILEDWQIHWEELEYNKHRMERKKEEFEFIKEIQENNFLDIIEIKKELIEKLSKEFTDITEDYIRMIDGGLPKEIVDGWKEYRNPNGVSRKIRKLQSDIDFLQGRKLIEEGKITEQDIVSAKKHPFEDLIELKNGKCCCPFHQEKTPSFSVHKEGNFGHCFGCNWSGDTIAFVMQKNNIKFI